MNWQEQLQALRGQTASAYAAANSDAVLAAVTGRGPDSPVPDQHAGARMVCNIASVHVPAFVQASLNGAPKPYKNGYDLGKFRVGEPPKGKALKTREIVDRALPLPAGSKPEDVYFGAVELNGSGIRFYGDVCLVLKEESVPRATPILDRNSYDLVRSPIRERIEASPDHAVAMRQEAENISGEWSRDLAQMAAIKLRVAVLERDRRLTTGTISDGILADEDYIEVLRSGSFGTNDLQEARHNAADAAQDALISDRWRTGPCPSFESLVWQDQRRRADEFLECANVPVRIVTTSGRVRA